MAPRNKEQLQEFFKRYRERNNTMTPKMKGVYALAARIKLIQSLKSNKVEDCPTPSIKTPRKRYIASREFRCSRYEYEHNANEQDLYLTRKELMEAEKYDEGKIRWENWERIIKNTRDKINEGK